MPVMTGGEALARSLYREGVRVIFGLPGVQLYHALDGLAQEPGIRFITTRHEQATAYMAERLRPRVWRHRHRYGGAGSRPPECNAAIGTAYSASSPVLVVAGQIQRELIGADRGMLHEINDQLDTIRPVTKWAHRILDPVEIPAAVHELFTSSRPDVPGRWR